ncbi:MAG: hypothetical protein P8X78_00400 [Nitrosopumilaceae archaeon]|jgi:uncharacterized coiled-coil protein SlyX
MSEDDKGKRFLELIDEQNNLQWNIIEKLSSLIKDQWNSSEKQKELESLVEKHVSITKELNSLDVDNSIL